MPSFLSVDQLAERYQVGRSTIWRWTADGRLPRPVRFSPGCSRWSSDAIEQREAERAQAQRLTRRRGQPKEGQEKSKKKLLRA